MAEEVGKYIPSVLNEVLSLNAQEFGNIFQKTP